MNKHRNGPPLVRNNRGYLMKCLRLIYGDITSFFGYLNWIIIFYVQETIEIDPVNHSLLSLIFPVHKLPSNKINDKVQIKILVWMVTVENTMMLFFHIILVCLCHFNVYNPWSNSHDHKLLIEEETFENSCVLVTTLFVAATLPILLSHFLQFKRYFFIGIK